MPRKATTLIVDDDSVARHVAHTALKAAAFETSVAMDALATVAKARELPGR